MTTNPAARPHRRIVTDARIRLAIAILGLVLACLGTANVAGSAPARAVAAEGR
jgi:hypothetical protein